MLHLQDLWEDFGPSEVNKENEDEVRLSAYMVRTGQKKNLSQN